MILELILLAYLILISIIDIRHKTLPSPLTTGMLLVLLIINVSNLSFGIIALVLGLFLLEAEFFTGVADLKVTAMLGLMINDINIIFTMILLLGLYGIVYKIFLKYILKAKKEIPFIPVFLAIYITLLLIGGIPL